MARAADPGLASGVRRAATAENGRVNLVTGDAPHRLSDQNENRWKNPLASQSHSFLPTG